MATFRNASFDGSSSSTQTDYLPTALAIQDGDIVFHFSAWAAAGGGIPDSMGYYDGTPHPTTPPGWTVDIDELVGSTWFYGAHKIAGPSEANQTFLAYIGASPAYAAGFAKSRGIFAGYYDYHNAIDAQADQSDLSATAATTPTVTPVRAASRLVTFHAANADPVTGTFSMSTPAGMTLQLDTGGSGSPGNDPLAICLSDESITGTSATGTRTSTPSAGSAGPRFGWAILLPSVALGGWGVGQIRMGTPATNALYLSGYPDWVSTPDSPANSIPGDIDIRIRVAPVDWTSGAYLMAKVAGGGSLSWQFGLNGDGTLRFMMTPDGSSGGISDSTAATGFTDGTDHWVRTTRQLSDGRVQFFTSSDGASWTQLGGDVFTGFGGGTTIFNSVSPITIGARGDGGGPLTGIVYYAELRDGIGGTVVQSFDAAAVTKLGTRNPTTVTAGGPWTVNGSAWDWVAA